MRIVIDGRVIQDHFPGIARYTVELARALTGLGQDEIIVLYDPGAPRRDDPLPSLAALPGITLYPTPVSVFSPLATLSLGPVIRALQPDIYHSPYFLRPLRVGVPTVVTLHDAIPLDPRVAGFSWRERLQYRAMATISARDAACVLTPSHHAASQLVERLGIVRAKIRVTPEGVTDRFFSATDADAARAREALGLPDRFFLYLGINKPHKNLERLVRAHRAAFDPETDPDAPALVIAGPWDDRYNEPRRILRATGSSGTVHFLDRVPESFLPGLYRAALAFVHSSLIEGFGLPVLEAMAAGTPVACSRDTATAEIVANTATAEIVADAATAEIVANAGLLFDPTSVPDIAATLQRLHYDPTLAPTLRSRGLAQARKFTWPTTAHSTRAAYTEITHRT